MNALCASSNTAYEFGVGSGYNILPTQHTGTVEVKTPDKSMIDVHPTRGKMPPWFDKAKGLCERIMEKNHMAAHGAACPNRFAIGFSKDNRRLTTIIVAHCDNAAASQRIATCLFGYH